jgi:hypothetical protein
VAAQEEGQDQVEVRGLEQLVKVIVEELLLKRVLVVAVLAQLEQTIQVQRLVVLVELVLTGNQLDHFMLVAGEVVGITMALAVLVGMVEVGMVGMLQALALLVV